MNSIAFFLPFFLFGAAVGSFIGVLAGRYSEEKGFTLATHGRSKCPHCRKTLRWYELVPLVSFALQGGKCRKCKHKLSWQYPIVEILSGLVLILVPLKLGQGVPTVLWVIAFLSFILISIIDLRLRIIPDRLVALIAFLGILLFAFYEVTGEYGLVGGVIKGSFIGSFAINLWLGEPSVFLNFLLGIVFGVLLFGLVYFLSRGRAMGFGDVKFAGAIGALLGWPDVSMALILAFVIGAVWGSFLILRNKKTMKDNLPFGPFMVVGVTLVFFFGYDILNGYFALFGIY